MRIYVDSNVYISVFRPDEGNRWVSFQHMAVQLFNRIIEEKIEIVISDHCLNEIKKHVPDEKIESFLDEYRNLDLLIEVQKTDEEKSAAKEMADNMSSHWEDTLHAIIAKRENAEYLVTRNVKDFLPECGELIPIVLPEALP